MNTTFKQLLGGAVVAVSCAAQAQYAINWFTLEGDGGPSSGGGYSVSGTIGQPGAGAMSGGIFTISGGFWSGVDVTGPLPGLSIRLASGNTVVLSWLNPSTGYVLQQTANMNAPGGGWVDVAQPPVVVGPNKEVTLPATGRFCLFRLRLSTLLNETFNTSDGGFTVQTPRPFDGPWAYASGRGAWVEQGQEPENQQANTSILLSPTLNLTQVGEVRLTLEHSWNFEFDGRRWDGGQIRISVNGVAFTAVPNAAFIQNGYGGNSVDSASRSELAGQRAFTASSGGRVTTIASLGTFNSGDTIQIQFIAAADDNASPLDDWVIDRVQIDQKRRGAIERDLHFGWPRPIRIERGRRIPAIQRRQSV